MINQLSVATGVVWGVLKASVISRSRLSVLIEEWEMKKPIRTLRALMGNCCRFSPLSYSVPDSLSICAFFGTLLTLVPFEISIVWGETKQRFRNLNLRTSDNYWPLVSLWLTGSLEVHQDSKNHPLNQSSPDRCHASIFSSSGCTLSSF